MSLRLTVDEIFINRLKNIFNAISGNDEAEQLAIRFIIGAIVFLYASSIGVNDDSVTLFFLTLSLGQALSLGYLLTLTISCCSAFYIKLSRPAVRLVMTVVDVAFFSAAMGVIPESTIPLFFIYLLIVLGLGFRFGNSYLISGTILSLSGFAVAYMNSDFWQENKPLGAGILIVTGIIPVYVSFFIRRLNIAKKKLEEAVTRADTANEAKSNFLANMSHELRTPLNGVITVSDLMMETHLSNMQKEYADTIQSSARTLLGLVNDVLDFSKIESEKVILDNVCFDVYDCINDVINIIKPLANRKNISIYNNISDHTPQYVYGDPIRLKQILINLANNAVKFTERGHISLHTYATETNNEGANFCFEVIDTGIGIAHEAQSRIFERFVQEDDSTTRRFGGTGLGTSIAKQLVELMGGNIGVTSNQGKGSRFWFEINMPVATAQDYESLDADTVILSANEVHIKILSKLLTSWNIKYVIRNDIESAVNVLHTWRHCKSKCTVLIDEAAIHMPPVRAAQLFKEVGVKHSVLLLTTMNPVQLNNPHVQMYYDSILKLPLDSRQLYHGLMGTSEFERHEGVVSLSSHIEQHACKNIKPLNILIAEDQSTNQFVFRRIMETQGHQITIVEDGQHALDILGVEQFDIAIVDINMPRVSGIEVIKMFKFMAPDSEMPFIVVTADSSMETLRECRELTDSVLIKPIEKQQLLDVVYKLASKKSSGEGTNVFSLNKFSDIPLMDIDFLEEMLGSTSDGHFMNELFSIFGKDANDLINKIYDSTRDIKMLSEAETSVHALKGISNNVSARRLAAFSMYCEEEIQNNPDILLRADHLIDELRYCLRETIGEMQAFLTKYSQLADQD